MEKYNDLDRLLKQVLSPIAGPGEELNQQIINRFKEKNHMKAFLKKRTAAVLIAAVVIVTMSITALAAWHLLKPEQVAEEFGNKALADAFKSENALEINKTVISGGYNITLLGITSGKGLSDLKSTAVNINDEKTYAVVSIARQDGSPMPKTQDEAYGQVRFFVSPLIKGQKPWQVNIASMNGGYSECVIDGVMYRLIECDGVEMFADRGLYLCVSSGAFYDINAYSYNEKTGEISPKSGFEGVNALFDLPLDVKKSDPKKADQYLQDLLKEPDPESSEKVRQDSPGNGQENSVDAEIEKILAEGAVVPDSIKEVTYDKEGMAYYEYNGNKFTANIKYLFEKDETGTKTVGMTKDDFKQTVVQFTKAADGKITGRTVILERP